MTAISEKWNHRWKRWTKLRFVFLYPIGLYCLLFAQCDDQSLRQGTGFIVAGLLIRLWANGYAIKMEKLTTSGPYAFVRNPLYLGSSLILLGFIIILKLGYPGLFLFMAWILVYARTIGHEEKILEEKFGDSYRAYKHEVPRMIPAFLPYRQGDKWPFSFRRIIESQEYKLLFWVFILFVVFYCKEEFAENKTFLLKQWSMAAVALALALIDLCGEYKKHHQKTRYIG